RSIGEDIRGPEGTRDRKLDSVERGIGGYGHLQGGECYERARLGNLVIPSSAPIRRNEGHSDITRADARKILEGGLNRAGLRGGVGFEAHSSGIRSIADHKRGNGQGQTDSSGSSLGKV